MKTLEDLGYILEVDGTEFDGEYMLYESNTMTLCLQKKPSSYIQKFGNKGYQFCLTTEEVIAIYNTMKEKGWFDEIQDK